MATVQTGLDPQIKELLAVNGIDPEDVFEIDMMIGVDSIPEIIVRKYAKVVPVKGKVMEEVHCPVCRARLIK